MILFRMFSMNEEIEIIKKILEHAKILLRMCSIFVSKKIIKNRNDIIEI